MPDVDLDAAVTAAVTAAVDAHRGEPGPLLVVLQDVVAALGHVPTGAVPLIAEHLNVSRAEVFGALTFYHDLHTEPQGRHRVQVCRAEACQSVGATALIEAATARLGVGLGQTSPDGGYTLEQVFCLGNCALGPAALIDGRLLGRLTADSLVDAVSRLAGEEGPR